MIFGTFLNSVKLKLLIKMPFVYMLSILAALITASIILICSIILKTHLAHEKLKRLSRGLKSCPGFNPLVGHIKSYVFRPNLSLDVMRLHEQCGKSFLVMMGHKPMCSSIDLDLIKYIAVDESQIHTHRMQLDVPIKEMIVDNIFSTKNWRPIRRALAPALRPNKFKTPNVSREIQNSIDRLIGAIERKLDDNQQQPIELNADDYFHRYSLDLVLNCFYKQDNLVDFHSSKDELVETIDQGLKSIFSNPLVAYTLVFSYLNPFIDWLIWHFTKIGKWRKQVVQFIRSQTKLNLDAKKQQQQDGRSLLVDEENVTLKDGSQFNRNMIDYVIDQYHSGKLTSGQYFHSVFFLFGAADKTSADGLASSLYYLALNADKQEKLRRDINLNGSESEYLGWVINETLRLSPPAPIGCSRTIERDIEIEGGRFVVPGGTCVLTPLYAIHRLKEYWGDDADEFRPERFAEQKSFHPCQFMPFGAGPRQCPGKQFALHESKLVLIELLKRYKFSGAPRSDEGFDSPFYIFTLPYEHIILTISRLD